MKEGAVDFLTKPVDKADLLGAIRASLAKDAENRSQKGWRTNSIHGAPGRSSLSAGKRSL